MSLAKLDAANYILFGEYYKVPELLKNETKQDVDVLSMLGNAYFYIGRFEQAYETYQKLYYDKNIYTDRLCGKTPEEFDSFGKTVFKVLERSGGNIIMDALPKHMDFEYKQSIEASDELYEETREYESLLKHYKDAFGTNNNDGFYMFLHKLDEMRTSKDLKVAAKSYFFNAELCLSGGDYKNAYAFYVEAAKAEVSKALYYGYAGHMIMKQTQHGEDLLPRITASILMYRAIDLDYNNARWHFYEGFILASLGTLFVPQGQRDIKFIKSAVYEMNLAKQLLRPDQLQLRKSIEQGIQIIERLM